MKQFKTSLLLLFFLATLSVNSQEYIPFYNSLVENVDPDNITDDLNIFENFGRKEPGTTAIENAKNWIIARYQDLGYTDIETQDFRVRGQNTSNIIITKTGSVYPNTFLIIDGHYDTVNGPGANDNGSGTVLLLEIARILKNVNTEYSIKFIHFSGEEAGLIGSEYYVNNTVVPENMDIKFVLNIDEVGGVAGMNNNTIVCERDQNPYPSSNNAASALATQEMANCFGLYSNLQTEISYAYGSDYMPFESNGEVITGLYEKNESPYPHSPYDTVENMDPLYVYEVTKGALGSALHFAVATELLNTSENSSIENISIFPNPTTGKFTIKLNHTTPKNINIKVFDTLGKSVYQTSLIQKNNTIDLSFLATGVYNLILENGQNSTTKKIVIE